MRFPARLGVALVLCAGAVSSAVGCNKDAAPGDRPAALPASPLAVQEPSGNPPARPTAEPAPATPPPAAAEAEEVPDVPAGSQSVAGTITLPKARRKDVKEGDTIFLVVRRAGGPPGPASMLAVQKLSAKAFPMEFLVSSRDAMVPGTPFEVAVDIQVRVDKDGEPMTRRKGDVMGEVKGVKVGTKDVAVPLDTVLAEDVTLGGRPGGPPPAGMPPGHP